MKHEQFSQALFQNILDTASDAILTIDEQQRIVMFNLQAEQVFGYAADEVLGAELSVLLPERFRKAHTHFIKKFGEGPVVRRLMGGRPEMTALRKDGSEFPVEISISKVLFPEGEHLYSAIVRDVTVRKQAEKALREAHDKLEKRVAQRTVALRTANARLLRSDEKFRAMFENSSIGMVTCEEGRKAQANRAFCELLGYTQETLPEKICLRLLAGDGTKEIDEVLSYFDEDGCYGPVETEYAHRDGTMVPIQLKGLFYVDSEEKKHIWLFVEDLRANKDLQKRLVQASKLEAIGELAANIAHEMNNPLGIISAKARLLLFTERDSMSSKVSSELEKIIEQSDRLSRLTRGLLDYSRPSFGAKGPIDVQHPLRKALDIVEHRCRDKGVKIVEKGTGQAMMIYANGNELEQVFLNLFLNAIDAMPGGGILTVRTERGESNHVVVVVEDTGEGMEPEVQARIFEPFFTTKEEGRGTGLGLSVCFGLVRSHNGSIHVDSTPGHGARFALRLPALEEG